MSDDRLQEQSILDGANYLLHAVGIHARALTFPTEELFVTALRVLVYMGQSATLGITYSKHAPDGHRLVAWSDSDWSSRRSTTGSTIQLAGGSIDAKSKRQDCVAGSSTHAEIVAASSTSNDVEWGRGISSEFGLPQDEPTPIMVDNSNVLVVAFLLYVHIASYMST